MTLEAWGIIAEITSSVAVLITLIFLVVQMRQTTNALTSQSRAAVFSSDREEIHIAIEHPEILNHVYGMGEMSMIQKLQLDDFLTASFRTREFSRQEYLNGILNKEAWESQLGALRFFLGLERVRYWWDNIGRNAFSGEFEAYIDEIITKNDYEDISTPIIEEMYKNWN
jgi:hypothetical protein